MGCETAEFLDKYGKQVTIVEMKPELASDVSTVPRDALMHSLMQTRIKTLTSRTIREITADGVVVDHEGSKTTLEGVDTIVLSLGVVTANKLADEIKGLVKDIHYIGDAKTIGNALDAIADGAQIGREI